MRAPLAVLAFTSLLLGCSSSSQHGSGGGEGGGAGGAGGAGGLGYTVGLEILGVGSLDSECSFSVDPARFLSEGSWDLDAPGDYIVGLIVRSLLESETNEGGFERNRVLANSIRVSLLDGDQSPLDLGDFPNPYLTSTSHVIDPQSEQSPRRVPVVGVGIPDGFREAVRASGLSDLVLELEVWGAASGGGDIRSSALRWPLTLCEGCLGETCGGVEPDDACLPGQNDERWCVDTATMRRP